MWRHVESCGDRRTIIDRERTQRLADQRHGTKTKHIWPKTVSALHLPRIHQCADQQSQEIRLIMIYIYTHIQNKNERFEDYVRKSGNTWLFHRQAPYSVKDQRSRLIICSLYMSYSQILTAWRTCTSCRGSFSGLVKSPCTWMERRSKRTQNNMVFWGFDDSWSRFFFYIQGCFVHDGDGPHVDLIVARLSEVRLHFNPKKHSQALEDREAMMHALGSGYHTGRALESVTHDTSTNSTNLAVRFALECWILGLLPSTGSAIVVSGSKLTGGSYSCYGLPDPWNLHLEVNWQQSSPIHIA